MVVENLIKPEWVEQKPLYALLLGACLTTIGIWIGAIIFTNDASIAGVLFTTISAVPFFAKILKLEETANYKRSYQPQHLDHNNLRNVLHRNDIRVLALVHGAPRVHEKPDFQQAVRCFRRRSCWHARPVLRLAYAHVHAHTLEQSQSCFRVHGALALVREWINTSPSLELPG